MSIKTAVYGSSSGFETPNVLKFINQRALIKKRAVGCVSWFERVRDDDDRIAYTDSTDEESRVR